MKKYLIYIGAFGLLALGIISAFIKMPIPAIIILELLMMIFVIVGTK